MASSPIVRITEEQYLEMERTAEYKSEYDHGEVISMAGAGYEHIYLARNLNGELYVRLRGSNCIAFAADCRVKIEGRAIYRYPDIAIFCGQPKFTDLRRDNLTNPIVIIEILSPSTEAYDRGRKFQQYQHIESLREYILVSTDAVLIERFVRDRQQWRLSSHKGIEATLPIEAANVTIPLEAIYANVDITENPD
jgi:Uma2 family endonuclease